MNARASGARGFRIPRCASCALTPALCVCGLWPPLESDIEVSVIMPASEARSASNSARLLALWLPRATSLYVRGQHPGKPAPSLPAPTVANAPPRASLVRTLDHPAALLARPGSALLFPAAAAAPASADSVRHLIVPDGTWAQARRIERRWFASSDLPRLALTPDRRSQYGLRRNALGLCTFEAVVLALGRCSDLELSERLLARFGEWAARARRLKVGG